MLSLLVSRPTRAMVRLFSGFFLYPIILPLIPYHPHSIYSIFKILMDKLKGRYDSVNLQVEKGYPLHKRSIANIKRPRIPPAPRPFLPPLSHHPD